jgi:hypothetical protein
MAVIERNNVINASAGGGILENAGAPGAGTNEVQTLTIGGTPTGGTFTLALGAQRTGAISWNATNATLIGNMNTALDAVFGTASIVAAVGTMTNGIGTATLTFSGNEYAKTAQPLMTATNSLTGTSPTLALAETTPGVSATPYQAPKGALVSDTTNGKLYINSGTAYSPTWTVVGTQT